MVKGPRGKGAMPGREGGWVDGERRGSGWNGGRDRSRELTSPSANFITELVVFAQIISIYSTQAGNLFASECMREWNLPRSPRPPMCGSCLSSRYPVFFVDETTYAVARFLVQRESRVSLMRLFKEIPWTPRQTFPP